MPRPDGMSIQEYTAERETTSVPLEKRDVTLDIRPQEEVNPPNDVAEAAAQACLDTIEQK